jgi:adenine phosphoribosyltransferase
LHFLKVAKLGFESMTIKSLIRTIPHYPKQGVQFRDITTLLKDPLGLKVTVDELFKRYENQRIDKVVGIESRGFMVGTPLAYKLGVGFVPVRKGGKLPAETLGHDYELEYGSDRVEIHTDAIEKGERILLVDDLIATGGTALAAAALINKLGGELVECAVIIDLISLGGRKRLEAKDHKLFALCEFEGD